MRSVTFIHAADLHLGAPFKGLRSIAPTLADILLQAIPEALRKIVDTALAEQVDFVVFAGDIFDNSHPSYADFALFIAELKRLEQAGIPVYFVTGNHDPYMSWDTSFSVLPKNTHLLGARKPEFTYYERNGEPLVLIGGRGYYTQSWPTTDDISEDISRETAVSDLGLSAPFMVGILHTGLDIDPTRSPVNPKTLLRRDVDYWACGHVHQPRIWPSVDNPCVVYSGCPQGRDMKEEGEHGIFKVTLTEGAPNALEFIPTAQVAWQHLKIDITECVTIADIQERIVSAEFAQNAQTRCQRMIFRMTLTGKTALHSELTPKVLEDMRAVLNDGYPFFFIDVLLDSTTPPLNYRSLQKEGLFPAVYLDSIKACRENEDTVIIDLEKQFYERDLSLPSSLEQNFSALCDDAETLVLDLLGRDGA